MNGALILDTGYATSARFLSPTELIIVPYAIGAFFAWTIIAFGLTIV
jgi:hypothetical protein